MNKKRLLIIATIFLILLILAVGAFFFLKTQAASKLSPPKKEEKPYSYLYEPGEPFVTNVQDSECLVKVSVVLDINEEKQEQYLDEQTAIIRDLILNAIREHSEKEMRKPDIQQQLSDSICKRLNEKYAVDFFVRAYITDIVIQ